MLWFTKDKRARMKRRYKERNGYASLLKRDLTLHNALPTLIELTEAGFSRAEADEHEFLALFGEPMPEHLRIAAHLETDLWVSIRTTLDAARNANITIAEYERLLPRVRQELTTLTTIIALEAEIMYSPLTKHFTEQLRLLHQARA